MGTLQLEAIVKSKEMAVATAIREALEVVDDVLNEELHKQFLLVLSREGYLVSRK